MSCAVVSLCFIYLPYVRYCCSLTYSYHSLNTFWQKDFLVPTSGICLLPGVLVPFSGECDLEVNIWCQLCSLLAKCQWLELGNVCVCVCVQMHAHIEIYIYFSSYIFEMHEFTLISTVLIQHTRLFLAFFLPTFVVPLSTVRNLALVFFNRTHVINPSVCNQSAIMAPASALHGHLPHSALARHSHTRLVPHMDAHSWYVSCNPSPALPLDWWKADILSHYAMVELNGIIEDIH